MTKSSDSFNNGAFQVKKPANPIDRYVDWTLGFGDEYSFEAKELAEVVNFLLRKGVLVTTPSGEVEVSRTFRSL